MIEFHAVSLLIGAAIGSAVATPLPQAAEEKEAKDEMSSLDARVMPFGKHEGARVDWVAYEDPDYLRCVMEGVDMDRWPGLYDHIGEALRRRGELNE